MSIDADAERSYRAAMELADAGQTGAAVIAYKALCSKHADPRCFIAFGCLLQKLGHWDQSIAQFLRGLELKPHYSEGDARLMLAESYLNAKQLPEAMEQWRIVAAMKPEYPSYDAVPEEAKRRLREHAV